MHRYVDSIKLIPCAKVIDSPQAIEALELAQTKLRPGMDGMTTASRVLSGIKFSLESPSTILIPESKRYTSDGALIHIGILGDPTELLSVLSYKGFAAWYLEEYLTVIWENQPFFREDIRYAQRLYATERRSHQTNYFSNY